ncbi:MAG TPA: metal-sulfur cluster assembly factor [Bacillota bacterium]
MAETRLSKDEVLTALKDVIDPELGFNIVDLGLIYGVDIVDNHVAIRMTVTTPGCPATNYLEQAVYDRVSLMPGVEGVQVDVVWMPPWTPDKMSDTAKRALGFATS